MSYGLSYSLFNAEFDDDDDSNGVSDNTRYSDWNIAVTITTSISVEYLHERG